MVQFVSMLLGDQLDVLKWARANDTPCSPSVCVIAAVEGHLDVLKWARANGCPWDHTTCTYAAKEGHLDVLKGARTNGCDWNKYTCIQAAKEGHLDALKWASVNGRPWTEKRARLLLEEVTSVSYNGQWLMDVRGFRLSARELQDVMDMWR